MAAPYAGLEHAAAPDRDIVVLADIVDFFSFAEAAYPANLDINDAAGAGFDGGCGVAGMAYRLIQANRGLQFALQPCVIIDVVVPQRLLDHQQLEAIEFSQVLKLVESVGRVGVTA